MTKRGFFYLISGVWLSFWLLACKERFEPNLPEQATGYLVVEGLIITGPGQTKFKLTRSLPLGATRNSIVPETRALLQIEGEGSNIFPLAEKGPGLYAADNLSLTNGQQYRLRIKTAAGKEYISDFTEAKKTPPIDSITWQQENSGIQIFVNTHNPQNNTRYYQWDYEETWEYYSLSDTDFKYEDGRVVERAPSEHTYRCWGKGGSVNLLLGSSAKLSQDVIYQQPLTYIPPTSIKLSYQYSIRVKQYALTRMAYEYLQLMRKNTETTGSFFDPQPSELKGNIRSVSDPAEPVIGYVSACDVTEKRIFIQRREIGDWDYTLICQS
ncbi:MAG: DUF4249 domain-containing protein [Adhaeribacter sp.]